MYDFLYLTTPGQNQQLRLALADLQASTIFVRKCVIICVHPCEKFFFFFLLLTLPVSHIEMLFFLLQFKTTFVCPFCCDYIYLRLLTSISVPFTNCRFRLVFASVQLSLSNPFSYTSFPSHDASVSYILSHVLSSCGSSFFFYKQVTAKTCKTTV